MSDPTSDEPGEGRVVLTGIDSEELSYRDHKDRRLYPKNDIGPNIYRMLIGSGPALSGTVDSGVLPLKDAVPLNLSNGISAYLTSAFLDTHRIPKDIWTELANLKKSSYMPFLVTTNAHSNVGTHMISTVPGGAHFHDEHLPYFPAWVIGVGIPAGTEMTADGNAYRTDFSDYSLVEGNPLNLKGVSFFNLMGCLNSNGAAAKGAHLATNYQPIAQVVSHARGAGNSMGYQTLTYFKTTRSFAGVTVSFLVGEYWFESLYKKASLSKSSGLSSGLWAEDDYKEHLRLNGLLGDCTNTESTPNYGWDSWVITIRSHY